MKKIVLFLGCGVIFAGCTVHGPSIDVPSVSVQPPVRIGSPNDSSDRYEGHHKKHKGCPPGLAKQGRC